MEHTPTQQPRLPPLGVRTALLAAAALAIWLLAKVVLVTFAAVLVAIVLCAIAKPITKATRIPHVLAVLLAAVGIIAVIAWPFTVFGARLWLQFDELAHDIPKAIDSIKQTIESHPSGLLLERIALPFDLSAVAGPITVQLTYILSSVGSILAYLTLLVFGAVYLALTPALYVDGAIKYVPAAHQGRTRRFFERAASLLRTWLSTQLVVVVLNAVLAGVGLWAFGVEEAAALAMLAGTLSFIPYVGTIVAMIIAALAVLPQGVAFSVYVLIVFSIATIIEGYFVTPYIQSKALALAPVVLIVAIFTFGVLFGTLGVILAAPLTVVAMAALETFYEPETAAG